MILARSIYCQNLLLNGLIILHVIVMTIFIIYRYIDEIISIGQFIKKNLKPFFFNFKDFELIFFCLKQNTGISPLTLTEKSKFVIQGYLKQSFQVLRVFSPFYGAHFAKFISFSLLPKKSHSTMFRL